MNLPAACPEARERKIVRLLCLLAAAHVFVFSAAFPFFSVVDEQLHFDQVVRYSQASPPRAPAKISEEALPYIVCFSSAEYLWPPESQPDGKFTPPPWTLPPEEAARWLAPRENHWRETVQNDEVSQPPLYYLIAGGWWSLGKAAGLHDGMLLYWLRFLNTIFVAALVWLGWRAAWKLFPENKFVRLAVPALIALLPQTAFYSINNDILSPLTFGAVFVLLLAWREAEQISPRLAAVTGLALAAAFLAKISNLPLLAVAGVFLALKVLRLTQGGKLRASVPALAFLLLCAGLPMAAWLAWCKINFGDFTGSALKIQALGWTNKPFAGWFQHPIFTAAGFWFFLKGNLSTFWQGEFMWHHQPLAFPVVDLFYVLLTLLLLAFALVALLRRPPWFSEPQRAAVVFSFACLASALAFFALLSVKYDFHDCFYPSRAHPFFVSGRLMLGLLIPFLILLSSGLDFALGKCELGAKIALLGVLLAFMLASEITIDWNIFPNDYNWFHM